MSVHVLWSAVNSECAFLCAWLGFVMMSLARVAEVYAAVLIDLSDKESYSYKPGGENEVRAKRKKQLLVLCVCSMQNARTNSQISTHESAWCKPILESQI